MQRKRQHQEKEEGALEVRLNRQDKAQYIDYEKVLAERAREAEEREQQQYQWKQQLEADRLEDEQAEAMIAARVHNFEDQVKEWRKKMEQDALAAQNSTNAGEKKNDHAGSDMSSLTPSDEEGGDLPESGQQIEEVDLPDLTQLRGPVPDFSSYLPDSGQLGEAGDLPDSRSNT
eukprot:gnl/MRDRNA2_/MRDRNA2_20886_c0_seq1.p1 gnl/MRDRNA2_/MRDRNA2_20886_c0~~gnl/MRDRNA2_/MRDRNA2_20886_c0_seq1.p1  ORF type:complete len:174 (+),score=41.87 gnl/MRDRNA2_/MRDRNA2_20886_c0_seq1:399-920(+)